MPLFAPGFEGEILDLTVTLSQVLFPILILLGVSGVVVGILNSYDRFGAFAISPLFWNLTIIARPGRRSSRCSTARTGSTPTRSAILVGTLVQLLIPACDLRNTPFRFSCELRLAQPGRAPGAAADAAGDDQPRPDQLQPADQQLLRQPRQRRGAGGDRQGVPDLPAAAGDLLGRDRDRALPDPGPLRQPRRDRQPAGDDGQRDAPDPLRPGPGRGRDPRPLRADDPARLPARRVRRRRRRRWSRRRSSGSPSRCRPTASTCCRPAPSSASSGPGWRPRSAAIDLVVSAARGARPLQALRRRRDRRRRPGSRPRAASSPRR